MKYYIVYFFKGKIVEIATFDESSYDYFISLSESINDKLGVAVVLSTNGKVYNKIQTHSEVF